MSRVMARMRCQFDASQLLQVMESMGGTPEVDAGYAGEGHRNWKALTLYSKVYGLAANASKLPVLDKLFIESGLVFRLARFMNLAPGGVIRKHTDSFLQGGTVRIHVPVRTHPNARLHIDGEICDWEEGQLWFGDFSKTHWGANNSNVDRIHLVMDVALNTQLLALVEDGEAKALLSRRLDSKNGLSVDRAVLERFRVVVKLPTGFTLPGLDMQPLDNEAHAEVIIIENELQVMLNGQPMLQAIPVSEEMVDLVGFPCEARLHYRFDGKKPKAVCLMIGQQPLDLIVN